MDTLSIPQILITVAPLEELPKEPYSPFSKATFQTPQNDDAFRLVHLTPPPVHGSKFFRTLRSPPCEGDDRKPKGAGLDRAQFEQLLNKPKKVMDLRKEVAVKVHKTKQVERRARFLSKILAPPSPTATVTPVTPPESPAVFHYSLPSPGLVSPLAHYESLHEENNNEGFLHAPCKPWVEQVDFKLLQVPKAAPVRVPSARLKQTLPSLEQISARLNSYRSARVHADDVNETPVIQSAPAQSQLVVGRLKMPVRSATKTPSIKVTDAVPFPKSTNYQPPKSPLLTSPSELKITTLVVPRTQSVSPTELTRVNLLALNSRESRSSAMLTTLRRRTQSTTKYGLPPSHEMEVKRGMRRHSAPPDTMPLRERKGFEHPILALPGAF